MPVTEARGSSAESVRARPRRRVGRHPAHRVAGLVAAAVLVGGAASACSTESQSADDAYRLGCPAIDAAISGSGTAKEATIKGLEAIRDSGQLDPQPQEWLETAILALQGSSPEDLPADARQTLVDGCADHGYPLQNLG